MYGSSNMVGSQAPDGSNPVSQGGNWLSGTWEKTKGIAGWLFDKAKESGVSYSDTSSQTIYSIGGITYSRDKKTGKQTVLNTGSMAGAQASSTIEGSPFAVLTSGSGLLLLGGLALFLFLRK